MRFSITPNGNLRISISGKGDHEWVKDAVSKYPDDRTFITELLEHTGWAGNGRLHQVRPEQVGALTDSPLLTNEVVYGDDGDLAEIGKYLWYFDSYALRHCGSVMLEKGGVTFHRAH